MRLQAMRRPFIKGASVRTSVKRHQRRLRGQANALLLIVSLLLPFAQFAFSSTVDADSLLPACCRIHGKHQCGMRRLGEAASSGKPHSLQLAQVTEKCPWVPGVVPSGHGSALWDHASDLTVFRSCDEQGLAAISRFKLAVSPALANCKRGPPNSSVSA
jgi:hypothetical protein